jgi:DNA-binding transcriptional regulator YbjK
MPRVEAKEPEKLRPYLFHGVDLSWKDGDDQATGDCPWCGREGKFSILIETGQWRCFVCSEGNEKGGGNAVVFLRMLHLKSYESTGLPAYSELGEERRLLNDESLLLWGAAKSITTGDWLLPGHGADGKLNQLYRYSSAGGRKTLLATPTLGHQLFGVDLYQSDKDVVYLCYSDDTEVLTSGGWTLFKDLRKTDEVASYLIDGSIVFEVPKASQCLDYSGPMVNFKAEWCDLLVTPDHRMLYKYSGMSVGKVRLAKDLGSQVKLPTTGVYDTWSTSISEVEARLLVAFVADGCIRRGFQLEFSFHKDRKKARLKGLLDEAGIPYKIAGYSKGRQESILVDRREAPFFMDHCPQKTWTGEEVNWPLPARRAMIDELRYWDGDSSKNNIRYFTSKHEQANAVSRVAAISGYSCQVRVEKSERPEWSDEIIVSLMDRQWRGISAVPIRQDYRGKVYCVTVSSGFVIVRRNGKTVVSGNCEGPWDGMALWETLGQAKDTEKGLAATSNRDRSLLATANVLAVPGCTTFLESWLPLFARKHVCLMYDNDYPRTHPTSGKTVAPAAYSAMQRVASILSAAEEPPKSIKWLRWGPDGYDKDLASGFDVRDFLTSGRKPLAARLTNLSWLLGKLSPIPSEWLSSQPRKPSKGSKSTDLECLPCQDWKTLISAWRKAMKWTPGLDYAFSVMLASVTSTKSVGDQLWIKVVSPPSTGKTSLCEAISLAKKWIKSIDTLTGIVSGYQKDSEGSENMGLVSEIKDKTLIIKDGDTLLSEPNLVKILSQLRAFYDRSIRSKYGNMMSADHEGINTTVIISGTSSLRQLDSSELGERTLDCVIMEDIDDELEDEVLLRVAHRAERSAMIASDGCPSTHQTPEMLEAMRLTAGYVNNLRENSIERLSEIVVTDEDKYRCTRLGKFVSFMRARPSKRQEEMAEREFAARLVSQLVRLMMCMAVVLKKKRVDAEVMRRVKKVAMDTARGQTMEVARHLYRAENERCNVCERVPPKVGETCNVCLSGGLTIGSIASFTNHTEDKTRTIMRFLRRIRAAESFQVKTKGIGGGVRWRLTKRVSRLYAEVMEEPVHENM